MTASHNHPPRCCCLDWANETGQGDAGRCPGCPEHGTLAGQQGITCPQCHQPAGRPHTDYCTLAPGRVWDGWMPPATNLVDTGSQIAAIAPACAYPASNHGDGRGCDHDDCPRHGHTE